MVESSRTFEQMFDEVDRTSVFVAFPQKPGKADDIH
jgi:hypothetical protein